MKKEAYWLLKEKYHLLPDNRFAKDIERIKEGEPVDYVIGFKEFLRVSVDLSKKPLIPREETEFWVKEALGIIKQKGGKNLRILDIFSGSGCIGLALLRNLKNTTVVFADKDLNAISQIKINLKLQKLSRAKVIHSDIFKQITGTFDYIFANPPYIPLKNKQKVQKSVLRYEPKSALFGGRDGLHYIGKFLTAAKSFLKKDGEIFMEFDPPQKPAIEKLIRGLGYKQFAFMKDQHRKWRWVRIKL